MAITHAKDGTPVHYPADPGHFEFDEEVSQIFPDMARRSIPNFYEAHSLHARIAVERYKESGRSDIIRVLDLGASRGAFAEAITREATKAGIATDITLLDGSKPMVSAMTRDFAGTATVMLADLRDADWGVDESPVWDVVVMNYVAQFIPPNEQTAVLRRAMGCVAPSGMFVYGGKEGIQDDGGIHEECYRQWRESNGYTRAEIEAKAEALRTSMWPIPRIALLNETIRAGLVNMSNTTRYLMFATYVATRE